jgi:hypothetical protein
VPLHSKPPRIRGEGTPWRQRMTKEFFLLSIFASKFSFRGIGSTSQRRGEAEPNLNIRNKTFVIVAAVDFLLWSAWV